MDAKFFSNFYKKEEILKNFGGKLQNRKIEKEKKMRKVIVLSLVLVFAGNVFARPPMHRPGWREPPRHHFSYRNRVSPWGALAIGTGLGAFFAWSSSPRYTYTERVYTTPVYTYTPPVYMSAPQIYVPPQPPVAEKSPTRLFCRSKNEFFPKVSSCPEGWLEVLNRVVD